ncbi:MAG: hypothetical protein ACI35T_01210 [Alistipes sp.]
MLSPSEVRLGIVVVRNRHRHILDVVTDVYTPLLRRGCQESNIQLKYVPTDFDITLGVLFFAEYTDVDGVIVVGDGYDATVAKSVLDLQIQWNMPVEYRFDGADTGDGCHVIEMVQLQSEMVADVPEEKTPASRRESIN